MGSISVLRGTEWVDGGHEDSQLTAVEMALALCSACRYDLISFLSYDPMQARRQMFVKSESRDSSFEYEHGGSIRGKRRTVMPAFQETA